MSFDNGNPLFIIPSRVHNLLEESHSENITLMCASFGYGKTVAAFSFYSEGNRPYIWLDLNETDNNVELFWSQYIHGFRELYPTFYSRICQTDFPASPAEIKSFLKTVKEFFFPLRKIDYIFDQYESLHNPDILNFLNHFLHINSSAEHYFHFVVISRRPLPLNVSSLIPYRIITDSDLSFSHSEVLELFSLYKRTLSEEECQKILAETRGWPLYIYLKYIRNRDNEVFFTMEKAFYKYHFKNYSPHLQRLLAFLSCLSFFNLELLKLADPYIHSQYCNEILNLDFIYKKDFGEQICFHPLYQKYLQSQKNIYDKNILHSFLQNCGHWYQSNQYFKDAIAVYTQTKDYENALLCIYPLLLTHGSPLPYTEVYDLIDACPHDLSLTKIEAAFSHTFLSMFYTSTSGTQSALLNLVPCLESDSSPDSRELPGESYLLLSIVLLKENSSQSLFYLEKAMKFLPNGSRIAYQNPFYLGKIYALVIENSTLFSADYSLRLTRLTSRWDALCKGTTQNLLLLLKGSLLLNEAKIDDAKKVLLGLLLEASHSDTLIHLYCYFLLTQIYIFEGDYPGLSHIQTLCEKYNTNEHAYNGRRGPPDILMRTKCFLHLALKGVSFIREQYDFQRPNSNFEKLFYAYCLIQEEKYCESILLLAHISPTTFKEKFHYYIISALANNLAGRPHMVKLSLQQLKILTAERKTWFSLFLYGDDMRNLIQSHFEYFEELFTKRRVQHLMIHLHKAGQSLSDLRYFEKNTSTKTKPAVSLTKKETEVLALLAKGFTIAQIAARMYIKATTAKTHISNIYNKLGAKNRGEAIAQAYQRQLLD
ncbi:ATP/maltotriose-dependent transcriptional regulator MalT [Aequitasia blattaphilus]|uniref:LuxR C-terminal-related transcriptional regulator n=1 Tax=Aequitasia blattaphilus TaxID=2949332 RepID=A0ABT1EC32_9FIRM|nr:LuxR C-terminal-related transcriptional regulator [Aequitasia blattaphilus]MCP1103368.1 LuxR C-terminal-related transcriptional regulator [Aequitasia blattaphilus]MCR8616008.1 LuxR C-terminal-related transcriptional regulator [Aequitasia blattaphilus]